MKKQIILETGEVMNDLLGFPNMRIIQRKDMLNFSLDSILLASFVHIPSKTKQIIDIGTGNAPLPLFLSTRTKAKIIGIDVQKEAVRLARKNIALNNLDEQITILEGDVNEIASLLPAQCSDLVISNPPFFPLHDAKYQNANEYLRIARHEIFLPLDTLLEKAAYVLNNNGYFAMVHRPSRFIEIVTTMQKYKLEPKRIQFIYPKKGTDAHMLLIEGRKNGNPGMKIIEPLIVHEADGRYSEKVLQLFQKI